MNTIPEDTQKMLDTLKKVATETLDRKQRLGEYAVIWKNGKPVTTLETIKKSEPSNKT